MHLSGISIIIPTMQILVKSRPNSRTESIKLIQQTQLNLGLKNSQIEVYQVSVKEPPIDGKANKAIRKALADYFQVAASQVRLVSGHTSKQKLFEIS